MKIRNGFVSNSSSSSFLIGIKKDFEEDICPHCGRRDKSVMSMINESSRETKIHLTNNEIFEQIDKNRKGCENFANRLRKNRIEAIYEEYQWMRSQRYKVTEEKVDEYIKVEEEEIENLNNLENVLKNYVDRYNLYKISIDYSDSHIEEEMQTQIQLENIVDLTDIWERYEYVI